MDENKITTTEEAIEAAENAETGASELPQCDSPQEADNSEVTADECGTDNACDEEKPPKKHRKLPIIILSPIILLILLAGAVIGIGVFPQNCEAGEKISLRLENIPIVSSFYEIDTDLSAVDTSTVGTVKLPITLFGVIPLNASVNLRDTIPPTAVGREIIIPLGDTPCPDDFISEAYDITTLEYSFVTEPDTSSDGTVEIAVTDEGNNTVNVRGSYRVSDSIKTHAFELGVTSDFMSSVLIRKYGLDLADLSRIDSSKAGVYRAFGMLQGTPCAFTVQLNDTTAPTADVNSFDILLGQSIGTDDIVTNISDASAVTVRLEPELDLNTAGHTEITVYLEDEYGNTSAYTSHIRIYNLAPSIIIEAGSSAAELSHTLSELSGADSSELRLAQGFEPSRLDTGTHETMLVGNYSTIPFEVIVEDTLPPIFSLRPMTVFIGCVPAVSDLVTDFSDASNVDFKFEYEPDVSKPGNLLVTVIATDAAGNSSKRSTTIKVSEDNIPPIIYGVKTITAYEGETVSYRSGVYAIDDKDGRISVKADSSNVNVYVPGTYYVTYTASDKDGNASKLTAQVIIKPITTDAVNEKADAVLTSIISYGMTDREKARAIYDWCVGNLKYSTSTSYLMGYFNKAAFSGFTRRYGNCYTYYAVASALLTRAGITNTVIQRNDARNPHYWNLVKIDGSWYHLDTCPQPSPHKLEVFLLTDSQLKTFPLDYYYKFSAGTYPATP